MHSHGTRSELALTAHFEWSSVVLNLKSAASIWISATFQTLNQTIDVKLIYSGLQIPTYLLCSVQLDGIIPVPRRHTCTNISVRKVGATQSAYSSWAKWRPLANDWNFTPFFDRMVAKFWKGSDLIFTLSLASIKFGYLNLNIISYRNAGNWRTSYECSYNRLSDILKV